MTQEKSNNKLVASAQPDLNLIDGGCEDAKISRPYPFYLAGAIAEDPQSLGEIKAWLFEWKWDGIRGQIIKRGGQIFIWSRGEELVTESFPELARAAARLPDGCALDGEILAFKEGDVLPLASLQSRIGGKTVSKKLLADAPVVFMAFDLLELDDQDQRNLSLIDRRLKLANLLTPGACSDDSPSCLGMLDGALRVSPALEVEDWESLRMMHGLSHKLKVQGIMIKRGLSLYDVGGRRGDWWQWKIKSNLPG